MPSENHSNTDFFFSFFLFVSDFFDDAECLHESSKLAKTVLIENGNSDEKVQFPAYFIQSNGFVIWQLDNVLLFFFFVIVPWCWILPGSPSVICGLIYHSERL